MKATSWDSRLAVRADEKNLVGHAGIALLRRVADQVGLTRALTAALPQGNGPGWRDRGMALVQLACAITLGATNILEAEQLQQHWRRLFPRPVSDSTLRRTLEAIDGPVTARVERVRAVIRRVVWTLLALRPGGFPSDLGVRPRPDRLARAGSRRHHRPLHQQENGEWLTYQVAELTGVRDLTGWPEGMRLIVRRVKPSRRDLKKLTAFERRTGWRYQIVATNIPAHHGLSGVPGSGQV